MLSVTPGGIGLFETDITVSSATSGVITSPQKVHVVLSNQTMFRRLLLPVIIANH